MKILVVDDEKLLVKGIKFNLENEGYTVDACYDGETAVEMARAGGYDLIILDLMMPRKDGLEACQEIRSFSTVPIIMLTARSEDADMLMGFESGADDYVTKPFGAMELISRVRAVLRRAAPPALEEYRVGSLYVCPDRHQVLADGQEVKLALKEFELLCLLLRNAGLVLTRDALLNQIWGYGFDGESRTVDVHIRNLRKKLGDAGACIETVKGVGYKIGGAGHG